MKKLTDANLKTLRSRCIRAVGSGFALAHSNVLINMLGAETQLSDTPPDTKKGSTQHLLALVEEAKAQRSGKDKPKAKVKPTVLKPKAKAKAETLKVEAPEPEKVEAPEPEKVEAPEPEKKAELEFTTEDVPPYEEWDQKELYAEAKVRDIPGRSNMSKDELITALYSFDKDAN